MSSLRRMPPCKKRKPNGDDDESIELLEELLIKKKNEAKELEDQIVLLKAGRSQHGISALEEDSLLRHIVQFLNPKEIFVCLCISKHWNRVLDDPRAWKCVAKIHHDRFVAHMVESTETVVDCRRLVKRLATSKPERPWRGDLDAPVDNDSLPTLAAKDLYMLIQVTDKTTGNEIDFQCKSFENAIARHGTHCLDFDPVPDSDWQRTCLPVRLTGNYEDHFEGWAGSTNGIPQAVEDSILVTVRLWRQDKQQALCLCKNQEAKERVDFRTLHTVLTSFPSRRPNSDAVVARLNGWHFALVCTITCDFGRVMPDNAAYDLDAWKRAHYFLRSLDFKLGCYNASGRFLMGSVERLLTLLNVLDWE